MPTPTEAHLAAVRDAMMDLPIGKAVDFRLIEHGEGRAITELTVSDEASSGSGHLHGTYLYALLDYTCFYAVVTQLGDSQSAATMDAHFSLIDPAPRGATVRLHAQVERQGRHVAFLSCQAVWVTDEGERTIALGRITKTVMTLDQRTRARSRPGQA